MSAEEMTLEEAFQVLEAMDRESTDRFTEEEREAIITIGVPLMAGELTEEQKSRWERLMPASH